METAKKTLPLGQTVITSNARDTLDINTRTSPRGTDPGTLPHTLPHTPDTQQRLARLDGAATWIFEDVLWAMQSAEELGGPVGEDYFALMQAIIDEATERAANYRSLLAESR